ncbi:MAG: TrkH family potassium uptake protein [Acidimicrobiia bacterium]|nr:TrkH family potassium uptake protein [Acidimicrobiia bacterium]
MIARLVDELRRVLRGGRARREALVGHVVGLVLTVGGLGMLASAAVALTDAGREASALAACGLGVAVPGWLLWRSTVTPYRMRIASVFAAVSASWLALALASTLPYLVSGTFTRFDDALFESVSGLTTTGATVLHPIEGTPQGILFWRALTQWMGGMGVIVLVVAVLPFLGAGGMELLEAESPGPTGERLSPRVRQTAQRLWSVYLGITVFVVAGYLAFGMGLFDAVAHAFTTVSTGGFGTRDASIAAFASAGIEWVAVAGMLLAGGSFTLYWRALRGKPFLLLRSTELGLYVGLVVVAGALALLWERDAGLGHDAIRGALFTVSSVVTTTGYVTVDFAAWHEASQLLVLLLLPLGAMAGSTSGGLKMIRVLVVWGYARRELARHLHPRLVRPVRLGRQPIPERTVSRVVGFVVLYLALFGATAILVAATGSDLVTSLSASATSLGNVGPGLGDIGATENFLAVDPVARAGTLVTMLAGRLEVYPLVLALAAVPLQRRPLRGRAVAWRARRARARTRPEPAPRTWSTGSPATGARDRITRAPGAGRRPGPGP